MKGRDKIRKFPWVRGTVKTNWEKRRDEQVAMERWDGRKPQSTVGKHSQKTKLEGAREEAGLTPPMDRAWGDKKRKVGAVVSYHSAA